MGVMDKLKLLVHDNIPSQQFVDYQVDRAIEAMIDAYLGRGDSPERQNYPYIRSTSATNLVSMDKEVCIVSTTALWIPVKRKFFDNMVPMVNSSLERYAPYVSYAPDFDPQFARPLSEGAVAVFELQILITPQMKHELRANE